MRRALTLLVVLAVLSAPLTGIPASAASETTVAVTDVGTVTVGNTTSATLSVTGVSDTDGVGAYTAEVHYDAADVSVSATTTNGFTVETSTPSAGVLRIVGYTDAETGPTGDAALASLSVTGEQAGETSLEVEVETLADAAGDDIGHLTESTSVSVGEGDGDDEGSDDGEDQDDQDDTSDGSDDSDDERSDDESDSSPDAGGGGGGGGGSGAPPADSASVQTSVVDGRVSVDISDAQPDEAVTVSLPEPVGDGDVSLSELQVTLASGGDGSLSVSSPSEPPAEASSLDADGGALSYFDVAHDVDDSQIGGVDFSLSVSKTRLDARGLDAADLRLYRYHDGEWNALPTRVVSETETGVELVATSPGLSVFALAASPSSAALRVTDVSLDTSEASPGESVTVAATVENVGGQDGTSTVDLRVDGEQRTSRSVRLGAGESTTVEFSVTFDEPGTYEVAVGSVSGESVVVSEPSGSTDAPTDAAETASATTSTSFPGFGVGSVLAGVVVALLAARVVRQRENE